MGQANVVDPTSTEGSVSSSINVSTLSLLSCFILVDISSRSHLHGDVTLSEDSVVPITTYNNKSQMDPRDALPREHRAVHRVGRSV